MHHAAMPLAVGSHLCVPSSGGSGGLPHFVSGPSRNLSVFLSELLVVVMFLIFRFLGNKVCSTDRHGLQAMCIAWHAARA